MGEKRKMNNKRCGLRSLHDDDGPYICDPAFSTGRGRIMGNLIVHDPAGGCIRRGG